MGPGAGFEPAPTRLRAERSTAELPRNNLELTAFSEKKHRRLDSTLSLNDLHAPELAYSNPRFVSSASLLR